MQRTTWTVLLACAGMWTTGCMTSSSQEEESAQAIGAALELENGGLDDADEAPMFGAEDTFASEYSATEDAEAADPMTEDPAVTEVMSRPDVLVYDVTIAWGQLPRALGNPDRHDWSGAFSLDRGAAIVRRVRRFEGRTDVLLPRVDPRVIPFASVTRPASDGMTITVFAARGESAPVLTYAAGLLPASRETVATVSLDALLSGPVELVRDASDNRMLAVAHLRGESCARGVLMGAWKRIAEGRGVFRGRVVSDAGELLGHVRGVWGVRRSGEKVFFAKYIDRTGHARGLLAGHYDGGEFTGRWIVAGGDHGAVHGRASEGAGTPSVGFFIGGYAETACH